MVVDNVKSGAPLVLRAGQIYSAVDVENHVPVEVYQGRSKQILQVPFYTLREVREGHCSKYVRLAAEELFGKKYAITPAWNRRYLDKLVAEVDASLEVLAASGIFTPGMILGIFNPKSDYHNRLDHRGEQARYTHVALLLGRAKDRRLLFAEQFGDECRILDEKAMKKEQLVPVEVLDSVPSQ